MSNYSLVKLKNDMTNHSFNEVYKSVFFNKTNTLDESNTIKLLTLALFLINEDNDQLFDLGYFIIVNYSIETSNYNPLLDISEKLLNFPVINFLYKKNLVSIEDNFFTELEKTVMRSLKTSDNYFYTSKQKYMDYIFFKNDINMSIIAPTSFGKTELIKKYVKDNYKQKTICIIEPTKSMLNQVRNDILNEFDAIEKPKIITHYDMNFSNDERVVLVLTQERLFKLVYDRKKKLKIDALLVDEAHNIFEKGARAFLLAEIIFLLKNKNNELIIKYFSPIIDSSNNLAIKNDINTKVEQIKISPKLKVEKYYYYNVKEKREQIYDQFLNEFYTSNQLEIFDKYDYIISNASKKNLLYLNRPKHIKEELLKLECKLSINSNENIEKICKTLGDYIDKDYDLIDYLRKGIAYHFGAMPDNVRNYVEKCVKEEENIKYIFCTSTLLEGVNMPFDKLFILDVKKGMQNLTYHQLKNLIGRVNRYNNIFDLKNDNLQGLISSIYFVKGENNNSSFVEFIKDNLKINSKAESRKDNVKNPLLENSKEILSETDANIIENLKENNKSNNFRRVKSEVGKALIELNINDFDIFEYEETIEYRLKTNLIKKEDSIVDKIYKLFIDNIKISSNNNLLLERLENPSARKFYNMIIQWRKENISLKESVSRLIYYWTNLQSSERNCIFVGKTFGEIKRSESDRIPLYVNLNTKSRKEMINLAIIRIKEENDYVDYNLLKYIEFLQRFELIDKNEYNLLQYGTTNEMQIFFQKEGLSRELSKLLVEKYMKYIFKKNDSYDLNKKILSDFSDNEVLKFELEIYLT